MTMQISPVLPLPSQSAGTMDLRHLDQLALLEDSYWWHISKRRLVMQLLTQRCLPPAKIVEGGVGGCGNLLTFRAAGYDVTGLDILPEAIEHGRRRGLERLFCHDLLQPWPIEDSSADVVVLLDVIEHVVEPALLLSHALRVLQPNGLVLVNVPAYQWLFGPWDKQLGHYRRYTAARLRADAKAAGLRVRWLSYWNAFSLPAAASIRLWQRIYHRGGVEFPHVSKLTNRCLLRLASVERCFLLRRPLPVGLSLMGVLTR